VVDLLLTLVAALVVGAVVFGVAAYTLGRDPGLSETVPDGVPRELPDDRPVAPSDITALRFDIAARGYRMAQVDEVLARLAYDLEARDEQIAALRAELASARREGGPPSAQRVTEAGRG